MRENVIEWIDGEDTIAVTLYQKRFVNKVKRLALLYDNVVILAENKDGSIFAHLPLEMLKLSPKRKDNLSVEQKSELAERMHNLHLKKKADKEV